MKKNCIEIDIKTFGLSDLANIQIQTFDKADREQTPIKVIGDPYQQGKSEVIVFAQPVPKDQRG